MARSLTCWRYPWARARTRIGRGWPRRGWNRARCSLLCSVGTRVNQPAMPVPARVGNGVATRVSTSASWDAVETWAPAKEKQKQQFFIIIPYPSYRFLANFRSVFCLLGAYDNFFVCLFQFFFFFFSKGVQYLFARNFLLQRWWSLNLYLFQEGKGFPISGVLVTFLNFVFSSIIVE